MAPRALTFDGDWFCRPDCLRDEAAERLKAFAPEPLTATGTTRFRLGTLLLASRAITAPVLERALARQRDSGRPLGAELIAMGAVDEGALTHALARQAGVPSVTGLTATHVASGVAGLSRRVVRALGVVPFEIDREGHLRVAVTPPLSRTALRALERMTGRTVRPYMVGDAIMTTLLDGYGTARAAARDSLLLVSAAEAGAHIAEAARAGRAAAWRCVPTTSFTWVRLEGAGGTDDLMVTGLGEGDTWQAAPTRH